MKTKYLKETKAITLIALVVTIVVLLILAGVSIAVLTGENGILNRATEAKKANEESEVMENIRLAYNNAQIGKYSGANEIFEDKMDEDLEKIYGDDTVTIAKDGSTYIIEIAGKGTYEILVNGIVQKKSASIVVGEIKLKNFEGDEITKKIVNEGTIYIHFSATLEGADNIAVTSIGLSPTFKNGEWITPVTTNGIYTFTITGEVDGSVSTTTKSVEISKFSNGLDIGSEVSYSPLGSYSWKAKYATSDKIVTTTENNQTVEDTSNDIELSSESGSNFQITKWKVLSIDEETGVVQLIPSAPTSGVVSLQGAQGYNNAVKLLNNACDSLYSTIRNGKKIITARSINIEDFEGRVINNVRTGGFFTDEAISIRNNYENNSNDKIKYGNRYTSTKNKIYIDSSGNYIKYKNYPIIYENEIDSIINGITTDGVLNTSSQTDFIERIDKNNNYSIIEDQVMSATSIRPKLTTYQFGIDFNTYKEYIKKYGKNSENSYADLLSPSGSNTPNYWIASRSIFLNDQSCAFNVHATYSGCFYFDILYRSDNQSWEKSKSLFPVISLNFDLITKDENSKFVVK